MPRITAALAIVATMTFCIGFNIVRYPAVWEMAADACPGVKAPTAAEPSAPAARTSRPIPLATAATGQPVAATSPAARPANSTEPSPARAPTSAKADRTPTSAKADKAKPIEIVASAGKKSAGQKSGDAKPKKEKTERGDKPQGEKVAREAKATPSSTAAAPPNVVRASGEPAAADAGGPLVPVVRPKVSLAAAVLPPPADRAAGLRRLPAVDPSPVQPTAEPRGFAVFYPTTSTP